MFDKVNALTARQRALLGLLACAWIMEATAVDRPATSRVVFASEAGAALDSNLLKGGGTDDTTVLQGVLDQAKDGRGIHLIVDGPAQIGGLDLYSNTTVECSAGGGFYFKDNTVRAIIRNAHRSPADVKDKHIKLRGCFINGNGARQLANGPRGPAHSYQRNLQEPDGTYRSGLQFLGVHHLTVENVILWDTLSYGSLIANAKFVQIRDVIVDGNIDPYPEGADTPTIRSWLKQNRIGIEGGNGGGDDGLDFMGPLQYVTIDGVKLRTWDDGLSFMANQNCAALRKDEYREQCKALDFSSPYVKGGPITDVAISNVVFMDGHHGIRFLSADDRVDRIVISNVSGTVRERFAVISHFLPGLVGNFGSLSFNNVNVSLSPFPSWTELFPEMQFGKRIDDYERHVARGTNSKPPFDVGEEADLPLFSLNARIEHLSLHQIVTSVADKGRPVIRVGGDTKLQTMTLDLTIVDPAAKAVPLKLLGRVERLSFSLNWQGENPIQQKGGSIDHLHWGRNMQVSGL